MEIKYYSFIFCGISIFAFILQVLIPGFTEMFVLNQDSFLQPWRFFSAIFLHGGLGHLAYNLFALAFFGFILEKTIGSEKFLALFLVSGIFANIIAVNFYNSSLGASGAIMGIIGTLALLRPLMMVWSFGMILPMFLVAIFWVVGDVLGIFVPDNVGNIAHLAGIFIGFLYGAYLVFQKRTGKQEKEQGPSEEDVMEWEGKYMG